MEAKLNDQILNMFAVSTLAVVIQFVRARAVPWCRGDLHADTLYQ